MIKKSENPLIATLFPEKVITVEADPEMIQGSLFPEESTFICNAITKRRKEFIAGRICARRALEKFGTKNFPLLMGSDRAPVWPSGIVGSISHTHRYCGVVIAQKTEIKSLGLDVEYFRFLERNFWKEICTQQELSWINSLSLNDQEKHFFLIFCAKECFYKCQYTISRQWLNFHDVEISVELDISEFEGRFLVSVGSFFAKNTCLKGKYLFDCNYVFTGMALTDKNN